ncbi:MAG: pyridoxamine 5'-phosphate oxidase family protein [Actinomycetota bacterium]|nr:pyridoxamine 5'-phosphate oxidase family protein [Actinomycetota bacterium]
MARLDIALSPQEVDAFLGAQRTARVATSATDGTPHVVPLWFVWMGGALFVNTTRGNQSVRNLEANPRAAATVDDGQTYDDLRGVVLTGPIQEATDDPRLPLVRESFGDRYFGGNRPSFELWRNRVFFRLDPERIVSWDFRKIPQARARRRST